jgi:predicted secreted acid phosphatase
MKIAFDLDSTLVDNYVAKKLVKENGYDYKEVDYQYSIDKMKIPQELKDEISQSYLNPEIMKSFEPLPYAKHVIETLVHYGHTVYIVTARNEKVKDATLELVANHFPGVLPENVILTNGHKKKLDVFKELEIEFVVDDAWCNLEDLPEDIYGFFIMNEFTPHNDRFESDPDVWDKPNIQVIRDLNEVIVL